MRLNILPAMLNGDLRHFLVVIFTIQIAFLGLIWLDILGFPILILRQFVGFVYLTFIPGILVLRILKLYNLDSVESYLFAAGISIGIVMFTGFFMNITYPIFGLNNPISLYHLAATISIIVIILMIFCLRDWCYTLPPLKKDNVIFSPSLLLLLIIPLLSIIGTYLVNQYSNICLLWILIPIIALIPFLIVFNKIPENLYPLAIFSISLALLYHTTLISNYIWGWDINSEYHFANLVLSDAHWNSLIPGNVNAMLSVVMIAPIYSLLLNMDLTWVFKIIYPTFFSFLPLSLFLIFRKQTNSIIAFLACFFFVAYEFYFFNAPTVGRQEVAELFLGLILLLLFDDKLDKFKRSFLLIIFIGSLIVSHYGTLYLFIFVLLFAFIFIYLLKIIAPLKISREDLIPISFIFLSIGFTIIWYLYNSNASAFNTIVIIGDNLSSTLFTEFLSPESSQSVNMFTSGLSSYGFMIQLEKYVQLFGPFFIFIGLLWIIFYNKNKGVNLSIPYIAFCVGYFGLNIASLIVPFFAAQLNFWRIYHLTLIVLSPFVIIGGTYLFKIVTHRENQFCRISFSVISVFLVIFLLFNSAWIYGFANEYPESIRSVSLYQNSIAQGNDNGINEFFVSYYMDQDVYSVMWLSIYNSPKNIIYTDFGRRALLFNSYGMLSGERFNKNTQLSNSYLYLGYSNYKYGIIRDGPESKYWHIQDIAPKLFDTNVIYTNDGAQIILG